MCAFGTMGDAIHHISKKLFKVSFRISERMDRKLKYIKYVLLGLIVVGVWGLGTTAFSPASPWNVFGILAAFGEAPDVSYAFTQYTVGFLLLTGIIAASFFIERFFCRYLCPLGTLFSLMSRLRIVKVRKPSDKCGSCMACTKSCSMGIPMYQYNKISSGECINCYNCLPACPRKNVSVDIAGEDVRPLSAGVLATLVMTSAYYSGSMASNVYAANTKSTSVVVQTEQIPASGSSTEDGAAAENNTGSTAAEESTASGSTNGSTTTDSSSTSSIYKDGTYQGSARGFRRGITTVSVTVKNDKITGIEVVSHGDDRPYFNRSYNTVVNEILDTQSTEVDAVSGATFSSNGIMNAVADALQSALR
jgi:uncharacterized protein with FMN-binding domain/ferredoxin